MKTKTCVKARGIFLNHNVRSLRVKTGIKAGSGDDCPPWVCGINHNERQLCVK